MKTTKQTVDAFNKNASDNKQQPKGKRQNSRSQQENADLRENGTNEDLLKNIFIPENEQTAGSDNSDNSEDENADNWRKYVTVKYEEKKTAVLNKLAVEALKAGVIAYFTENYNETFASNLFAAAAAETNNFNNVIVDTFEGEMKAGEKVITIGDRKFYSIATDKPTTAAAACIVFNSYFSFAKKMRLQSVNLITAETDKQKNENKVNKLTDTIGINNLAELIANNPELLAAILTAKK